MRKQKNANLGIKVRYARLKTVIVWDYALVLSMVGIFLLLSKVVSMDIRYYSEKGAVAIQFCIIFITLMNLLLIKHLIPQDYVTRARWLLFYGYFIVQLFVVMNYSDTQFTVDQNDPLFYRIMIQFINIQIGVTVLMFVCIIFSCRNCVCVRERRDGSLELTHVHNFEA